MRKEKKDEKRVLARVLAEELKKVRGGENPVYETFNNGRKDITDAANGDKPPV